MEAHGRARHDDEVEADKGGEGERTTLVTLLDRLGSSLECEFSRGTGLGLGWGWKLERERSSPQQVPSLLRFPNVAPSTLLELELSLSLDPPTHDSEPNWNGGAVGCSEATPALAHFAAALLNLQGTPAA